MELQITPQPQRNQGEYLGGYQWQEEILFHQGDSTLHARMSTLISHLVSVAGQHYRHYGKSYQRFLDEDTAYVLTRATFHIHKLPPCFQLLNINTWIDGTKGPFYQRVVQWQEAEAGINQLEGEVLVECRSDWVIMAPSTRSLVKPDKNDPLIQFESPLTLPPHQRIKISDGTLLEKRGDHTVVWSEIDANGHLYSGHYGDIIWNILPEHLRLLTPTIFRIEYIKECSQGDVISLSGMEITPLEYTVLGNCNDNLSFKAVITFT